MGPGEKLRIHDEDAERAAEIKKENAAGGDIGSLVLTTPTIRKVNTNTVQSPGHTVGIIHHSNFYYWVLFLFVGVEVCSGQHLQVRGAAGDGRQGGHGRGHAEAGGHGRLLQVLLRRRQAHQDQGGDQTRHFAH